MKRTKRLVAERAALPFIPLRNHIPNQAALSIGLDFLQAVLPASLALGPAGAFFQTNCGLVEDDAESGFTCGNADGGWLLGLRAGHDALAAPFEQSANTGHSTEHEKGDREHQNRDYDRQNRDRHRSPPSGNKAGAASQEDPAI